MTGAGAGCELRHGPLRKAGHSRESLVADPAAFFNSQLHGITGLQPKRSVYTAHFKLQVLSHQDRERLSRAEKQAHPMKTEKPTPEPQDTHSASSHRALREELERLRAEVA